MATQQARILLAEDDETVRTALEAALIDERFEVTAVADGSAAIQELDRREFDVVLTDIAMPGADGITVLKHARETAPRSLVVVMTANATVESAVAALHEGAQDYILKPLLIDDLLHRIRHLLEFREAAWDRQVLRRLMDSQWDYSSLVGRSQGMQDVMNLVKRVAPTPATVLITGESGTGKEIVARAIHHFSECHDRIFLPINCGAIPETLLESQLFGHMRGSFTGATANQEGLFQQARGGTLFLDEIGDMPLGLQVKLLRAIETKEVLPLGGARPVRVDFRLIAATNRNLAQAVDDGRFREDLYYRLKVVSIEIPALRERREDIPPLVEHFVRSINRDLKKNMKGADAATLRQLVSLPWKGNVRELRNVIEHAMILAEGDWITPADLPREIRGATSGTDVTPGIDLLSDSSDLRDAMRRAEALHIRTILTRDQNDKRKAARDLGISLSSLYRKIEELGI